MKMERVAAFVVLALVSNQVHGALTEHGGQLHAEEPVTTAQHARDQNDTELAVERCTELLTTMRCGDFDATAFVHINKAGGTTIAKRLKKCKSKRIVSTKASRGLWHNSVDMLFEDMVTEKTRWDPNATFYYAAVRNPYDRMVSLFYYRIAMCTGTGTREGTDSGQDCNPKFLPNFKSVEKMSETEQIKSFHKWLKAMDKLYPETADDNFRLTGLWRVPRPDASGAAWLAHNSVLAQHTFWFDTSLIGPMWEQVLSQCVPECKKAIASGHPRTDRENSNDLDYPSTELHYEGEHGAEAAALIERRCEQDFHLLGYKKGVFKGPPAHGSCGGTTHGRLTTFNDDFSRES